MVRFTSEIYSVNNSQKELLIRDIRELFNIPDDLDIETEFEEWKEGIVKGLKLSFVLLANVVYKTGDNTAKIVDKYGDTFNSIVEFKKDEL